MRVSSFLLVILLLAIGCAKKELVRLGPAVVSAGANMEEVVVEVKAETAGIVETVCGWIPFNLPFCEPNPVANP